MATLNADFPEGEMALERVVLHVVDEGAGDHYYLVRDHVQRSEKSVSGRWRCERIERASHGIPLDAPEYLNELMVDFVSADCAL